MSTRMLEKGGLYAGRKASWLQRKTRKAVIERLSRIEHGELTIRDGDSVHKFGRRSQTCGIAVTIDILDPEFYVDVALGGSVGGAEAYMEHSWACDDLTAFIRLLIRNRHVLNAIETGIASLKAPLRRWSHWTNRNHMENSRKNIQAHYDLGNEFFELFLDPTMMYSSGIFPSAADSLESASLAKLERICRKLELSEADHVIEIGTGWGGFAEYAATRFGCRVTTTTISREQFEYSRERINAAGLSQKVTLLDHDYRLLDGQYDKLVSIEMIEAVGHEHFDVFFSKCSELLKPEGMMLLQSITIADHQYDNSRKSVDFIQKYIFPGGALPSLAALTASLGRATDLSVAELIDIGPHYAETLRRWRHSFFDHIGSVREMGFPEEFIRMWEYYFCYCEAGFEERVIGDLQILLRKPLCRSGSIPV